MCGALFDLHAAPLDPPPPVTVSHRGTHVRWRELGLQVMADSPLDSEGSHCS